MNIQEVSQKFQISADTLRYYEKINLIENVPKKNGKRTYNDENLDRIHFILCMKNAGFSLEDIAIFLSLYKQGEKTVQKRLDMLLKQKEKLLEEIKKKQETLNFLEYKISIYSKK